MDSPKSDGNAAEPSFPVSSLPAQSSRTSRYTPRLSESSFPATPPVFGSPGLDLQQGTRFLKRKHLSVDKVFVEIFNLRLLSTKKAMRVLTVKLLQTLKRETYIDESEGCKRCNCKRSKCLKLYCECFAAGIYCVDSCACENCYNKPEYEDTVSDVREQIESRNPLAFAPTVVNQANTSPNVADDQNWISPSSARHKRGCKCKRSKCLKKYCECYRAKVGCSDGCRCECCDNYFGKKSAYDMKGYGSSNKLKDNSNPINTLKAHSPKQKRISPPQHQSDRSDSRSKPGLQSGPKFILQAVASSPPLTPYCNTEDRMNQMEIDSQGSSHDFKCQE
ncbi:hypothetical protein CCACVL1_27932 [Corchorus capsularis]|uniref:CRC domain-containing protein n=1 Tax=Corchorus capsularis TaxID=210143 RepID=A0A1R3G879_COCAP|nr:hypothetical protein CCACVL1_27932 [Corchorus capsularis]